MTLGKVERFWATLWQQFLTRAQFESFEVARERIRFWIKHYNHKRPNQGIGGLCPADRFFEIQTALRKTIEAGIQDNLLEMVSCRSRGRAMGTLPPSPSIVLALEPLRQLPASVGEPPSA